MNEPRSFPDPLARLRDESPELANAYETYRTARAVMVAARKATSVKLMRSIEPVASTLVAVEFGASKHRG